MSKARKLLLLHIIVHVFVTNVTLEKCNTLLDDRMGQYVDYVNDDYKRMGITYSAHQNQGEQYILYSVKQPDRITVVRIGYIDSKSMLIECQRNEMNENCCYMDSDRQRWFPVEDCPEKLAVVVNESGEVEYEVTIQYLGTEVNVRKLLIWFTLSDKTNERHYFSQHDSRDGSLVCPEFAIGMAKSTPPELGMKFARRFKQRDVLYTDWLDSVPIREFTGVSIDLLGFRKKNDIFEVIVVQYDSQIGITFKNTSVNIQERQGYIGGSMETHFTLRVQWHPEYRDQIRRWNCTIFVERHVVAVLFIIRHEQLQMMKQLSSLMQIWVERGKSEHRFELSTSLPQPALKLVGIRVTSEAIFNEGQDKLVYLSPNDVSNQYQRFCYRRFSLNDSYTLTDRMVSQPGKAYFEMRNLTIEDSAMYWCKNSTGVEPHHDIIKDYYVIVLPRQDDLSIYFHKVTDQNIFLSVDTYPYVDALGRNFLFKSEQILAQCVAIVSRAMVRFISMRANYAGSVLQPTRIVNHISAESDVLLAVQYYYLLHNLTSGPEENEFNCILELKDSIEEVQDYRPSPHTWFQLTINRTVIYIPHKDPLIISSTIETYDDKLTDQLQSFSMPFEQMSRLRTMKMDVCKLVYGTITGSFVALIYEFGGWSSVMTISKVSETERLGIVNCSVYTQKIMIRKNDRLLNTTEMRNSETLIAKQVWFECPISKETNYLLLTAFNTKSLQKNTLALQRLTVNNLSDLLKGDDSMPNQEAADKYVSGTVRLAKLIVGWYGTVQEGSSVQMLWQPTVMEGMKIQCTYSMTLDSHQIKLSPGFEIRKLSDGSTYELVKSKVNKEDGGFYRCAYCSNCTQLGNTTIRQLIVLPNSSSLDIHIDHGEAVHAGTGSVEDPIRTKAKIMIVNCSYSVYGGLLARFDLIITYDTCIPNSDEHWELKAWKIKQQREPIGNYDRITVIYEIGRPNAQEYWKYARVNCHLIVSNLTRDPEDITEKNRSMSITRSVYLEFNLPRPPVFISELLKTSSPVLTDALRREQAAVTNVSKTLTMDSTVTELENTYTIRFTMFMGIPRGWTTVWTASIKSDELLFSNCTAEKSIPITNPKMIPGLEKTPTYQINGGINFVQLQYDCLLDVGTVFLVVAGFTHPGHNQTERTTENALKQKITNFLLPSNKSDFKTNTTSPAENDTIFRIVPLHILWSASVNIGQSVVMFGRRGVDKRNAIQCFYKSDGHDGYVSVPAEFKFDAFGETYWFRAQIEKVQYYHSGTYKCNLTTACLECTSPVGMEPRELIVYPASSILSLQFSHEELGMNETSVTNFSQYMPNGLPYLMAGQRAGIRCVHQISPSSRLQGKLNFFYQMYDPTRNRSIAMETKRTVTFTKNVRWTTLSITGYTITAPDAATYKGTLSVVCQLTYRPGTIPNDMSEPVGVLRVTEVKQILVRISAGPQLFPTHLRATKPGLLVNWRKEFQTGSINSVVFHRSVSTEQLEEDVVYFESIQALGIPAGFTKTWTIYRSRGGLEYEECLRMSMVHLKKQQIPSSLLDQPAFYQSGGKNFINITFLCTLQPRHVALVFLIYNTNDSKTDEAMWEQRLIHSVVKTIYWWLTDTNSPEPLQLNSLSNDIRVSYGVIKLNIGWKASVSVGESWKILVHNLCSPTASMMVFYQQSDSSIPTVWKRLTSGTNQSVVGSNFARLEETGIYSCVTQDKHEACNLKPCFLPRRLLVLPNSSLLHMYVNHRLFKSSEEVKNDDTLSQLGSGQEVYVYCAYVRPKSFRSDEVLRFSYELTSTTDESSKILPFNTLSQHLQSISYGTRVIHPFLIKAPTVPGSQNRVIVQCDLSFDEKNFDSADIMFSKQDRRIQVSRQLAIQLWLKPAVYTSFLGTSDLTLRDWLRKSFAVVESPIAFHRTVLPKLIAEGPIQFSLLASHGVPKGSIYTAVFTEHQLTVFEEPCTLAKQINMNDQTIPSELLRHPDYEPAGHESIVWTSFNCTLRVESFALGTIVYTSVSNVGKPQIMNQSIGNLITWFRNALENPLSAKAEPPSTPNGSIVIYMAVKLHVGWPASVPIGAQILMFGYKGTTEHQIQCSFQFSQDSMPMQLGELFRITVLETAPASFQLTKSSAEYNDSGIYTCVVHSRACQQCVPRPTITQRRLVVLPDLTVVRMFLTHNKLSPTSDWTGNFTHCDDENRPVLHTGSSAYAHCLHTVRAGAWLKPKFKFTLYNVLDGTQLQSMSATRLEPLSRHNSSVLNSSEIHLPTGWNYGSELLAECRWKYTFPETLHGDLNENPSPVVLKLTKTILVRQFVRPVIHSRFILASKYDVQVVMRRVHSAEQNAVLFHSRSRTIKLPEQPVRIQLILTLGVPRGWISVWTAYKLANRIRRENCSLVRLDNLTDQVWSDELTNESTRSEIEQNGVNASFICTFRREHLALFYTVHNVQENTVSAIEVGNIIERSMFTSLQHWIEQPRSKDTLVIAIPESSLMTFRVIKLTISWLSELKTGDHVKMLGNIPSDIAPAQIDCFYQFSGPFKRLTAERNFRVVNTKDGLSFYLVKTSVDFYDSGLYVCNVTTRGCANCTAQFGFIPRRLTVKPGASTLMLYLNHHLVYPTERNFTQCTTDQKPYLLNGQAGFIYCSYQTQSLYTLPVHSVNISDTRKRTELSNAPEIKYIRQDVENKTSYKLISQIYRIRISRIQTTSGLYKIRCTLTYPNSSVTVTRMRTIHVINQVKPVIFNEYLTTTRPELTKAFRRYLIANPKSALEFHTGEPREFLLEGRLRIQYIVGLGEPKGWCGVDLFFVDKDRIRRKRCTEAMIYPVEYSSIPPNIQNTTYFVQSSGRHLFSYTVHCLLTPNVVAILLTAMNGFSPKLTDAARKAIFYHSVYETVENWFRHPDQSTSQSYIQIPPGVHVHHSLFRLRVGWRATIFAGDPIIMVGFLLPGQKGELQCYHRVTEVKTRKELLTQSGSFALHVQSSWQSFELIKPVAVREDTGIYDCFTSSCLTCTGVRLLVPHYLTVLSRHLEVSIHYSKRNVSRHSADHMTWTFDQYIDSNKLAFIYETQHIWVICDYHLEPGESVPYEIGFYFQQLSQSGKQSIRLPSVETETQTQEETDYTSLFKSYRITGPSGLHPNDAFETKCELRLNSKHITSADVNLHSVHVAFTQARQLYSHRWVSPTIHDQSIVSDDRRFNQVFDRNDGDRLQYEKSTNMHKRILLNEGLFKLSYSWSLGVPHGWSAVFSVYKWSAQFASRLCKLDKKRYIEQNVLDTSERLAANLTMENRQYICVLLPEQVAIVIYVAHCREGETNQTQFEYNFLPYMASVVGKSVRASVPVTAIEFLNETHGDYRLFPVRVQWKSVLKIGQYVEMYGLLSWSVYQRVICLYGYTGTFTGLVERKNFTIELYASLGYFVLSKQRVQVTDSGVYECKLVGHVEDREITGFIPRTLFIRPDSSILSIQVERSDQTDSQPSECIVDNTVYLVPGEQLLITCSHTMHQSGDRNTYHTVSHGFVDDPSTHMKLSKLDSTFTEGEVDDVTVKSSGTLRLPRFTEPSKKWFVQCELLYALTHAQSQLREDIQTKVQLRQEKQFFVLNKRHPRILSHRVLNSAGAFVKSSLEAVTPTSRPSVFYLQAHSLNRVEEDEFRIVFTSDVGVPEGWTFIRLFYLDKNETIYPDRCRTSRVTNKSVGAIRTVEHKSECVVQPEHVALLMATVNLDESVMPAGVVESQMEKYVLTNLTNWLGYDKYYKNTYNEVICFNYDYRLVRLHIGWRAIVNVGQSIRMQGRTDGLRSNAITCFNQINHTMPPTQVMPEFQLKEKPFSGRFHLTKHNAQPNDTGIYYCQVRDGINRKGYIGMHPRKLIVLPSTATAHCDLTLDREGERSVKLEQSLPSGMSYLFSRQMAFVQCTFEEELRHLYSVTYQLFYGMQDGQTETVRVIDAIKNVSYLGETVSDSSVTRVYGIISPEAKDYTGLLKVVCLNTYDNLTSPFSLTVWNESIQVECTQYFTIQEAANGNLTIESLSDWSQPVPLGSEFLCTGGYGMPKLTHSWMRVRSELYTADYRQPDLAKLLPADGGGWGGPMWPFVDMPFHGLEVDKSLLRVPEHLSYRGMSYLYVCIGQNTVQGKTHYIRRIIYLSVLICSTDRGAMDLSILLSTRLMTSCRITENPHPDIQHYGYYYLTLVRQLILGLPYGVDRTRFTFVKRLRSQPTGKNRFSWTQFREPLNREQTVERLYSRAHKPVSGQAACTSRADGLTEILQAVTAAYEAGFTNNPTFFLVVDNFLQVDYSPELVDEVIKMNQSGIKIILAFSHPEGGRFREFNEKLVHILQPMATVHILPNFEGSHDCQSCTFNVEDRRARIQRTEVFDQLCQASGSELPAPIPAPKLSFSLPKRFWFPGMWLLVTCTESEMNNTNPSMLTDLHICMTSQLKMRNLTWTRRTGLLRISKTCRRRLTSGTFSQSRRSPVLHSRSITSLVVIQEALSHHWILCYQRVGEETPKPFDAVNFTKASIESPGYPLGRPQLRVIQWPRSETRAILFQCTFRGFLANSEAILLYQPYGNSNTSQPFYELISRATPRLNLTNSYTVCELAWLEFSAKPEAGQFRCLIRPVGVEQREQRFIHQLPNISSQVTFSEPLNSHSIFYTCPQAPRLIVEPDNQGVSLAKTGTRLEFRCETDGLLEAFHKKLFYLTPTFHIIICLRAKTSRRRETRCVLVHPSDTDCSHIVQHNTTDTVFYKPECFSKPAKRNISRIDVVSLTVIQSRLRDFSSRVFCQTMDVNRHGTHKDIQIQYRLTSRMHIVQFKLQPQITGFYFSRNSETWKCQVAAYPFVYNAQIRITQVNPKWLGKQLEVYKSMLNITQSSVPHEQVYPKRAPEPPKYMGEVIFQPFTPVPHGLTKGLVKLQCTIGEATRNLVSVVGQEGTRGDYITVEKPILRYNDVFNLVCTLKQSATSSTMFVSLHKWMQSYWLNYDITVVVGSFSASSSRQAFDLHEQQSKFRPFGAWTISNTPLMRVLTDQSGESGSVDISILGGTEFDTASYFCTGHSTIGTFQRTKLWSQTIEGVQKGIALGYRLSNIEGNVWLNIARVVPLNQRIHIRCVVWTTDPANRALKQFSLIPWKASYNAVRTITGTSAGQRLVIRTIDHYEPAKFDTALDRIGCAADIFKPELHQVFRDGPRVSCQAPNNLYINPDYQTTYPNSAVIECSAEPTCASMQFHWIWVAGPVPHMTVDTADLHTINYTHAGLLRLSALPRPGSYLFRCQAVCKCEDGTKTTSLLRVITVEPRIADRELMKIADPGDVELDITTRYRPEETSMPIEELLDRLKEEKMTSVPDHFREVTGGKTEHIKPELIDFDTTVAIPKYTFLRCPYDITSRSSKPMREYLYRVMFKNNHEQYAIRRHTEHGFEITVPELCFHQFNGWSDRQILEVNDKVVNQFAKWRPDVHKLVHQTEQKFRHGKVRNSESINEERISDNVIPQERIEMSEHQQLIVGTHANGLTSQILKIRPEVETPDFIRFRLSSGVDKNHRLSKSNEHEMHDNTQQTKNQSKTSQSSTVSGLSLDTTRRPRQSEKFMTEKFRTRKLQNTNEYDIMIPPLLSLQSRQATRAQYERKLDETLENDPFMIGTKVRDRTVHFRHYGERLHYRPLKNHESMLSVISHRYKNDSPLNVRTLPEITSKVDMPNFERTLFQNTSWLEKIQTDHQLEDIQWIFDSRLHQYTRKRDEPIHFDNTKRKKVPTDREDIEIYKRERHKHGTPWWAPIVRWTEGSRSYQPTTETSKAFMRSLDREVSRDRVVDITHASAWTGHLSGLPTLAQDRLLFMPKPLASTKSEDTRSSHQATIDPSFVILPAGTTASCQIVLSKTNITQQIILEWYRYSARTERPELILSISLGEQKPHTVSPRFLEPNRIYAYPPLKWTDTYTVNINPLDTLDYGYYACRNRYMSVTSDSPTIEITKFSPHPLCIMQRGSRPQIRLMSLMGSRLREVVTYSNMWSDIDSVKSSTRPTGRNKNNGPVSECLEAGVELIVFCMAVPFQLLCERADHIASGLRLMDTRTQAYLHVPAKSADKQSRTLELPELTHEVPLPDTLSSLDWTVQFRAWRITLHSKHADASVFCKAQPELRPASFATPDYWEWLKVQLTPERRHQLSHRSLPLKLCVSFGPSMLTIYPRPMDRGGKLLLALVQIQPHQELTCSLSDTAVRRLNLTIYPIAHGKVLQAEIEGLSNLPSWRDPSSLPNPWPQTHYPNRIGVLIPSNWSVLGYYFVHCAAVGTNITSTFILNVQPPQSTLRQLEVDVRKAWMVIMLPLLVLIYTYLRRCMHERHERKERRLLALFRDIGAEISLDDV